MAGINAELPGIPLRRRKETAAVVMIKVSKVFMGTIHIVLIDLIGSMIFIAGNSKGHIMVRFYNP